MVPGQHSKKGSYFFIIYISRTFNRRYRVIEVLDSRFQATVQLCGGRGRQQLVVAGGR
jgi:hypothetical protein